MKIQAISDTHGRHEEIKIDYSCDVLIHAGDCTNSPYMIQNHAEFVAFKEWFLSIDIPFKIIVPGNHDAWATFNNNIEELKGVKVLKNEIISIEGIEFLGTPYTPTFGRWYFMKSEEELYNMYYTFPKVDVLISHGPPKYIKDINAQLNNCGSSSLAEYVLNKPPTYHVFGHVHNNMHIKNFGKVKKGNTTFMNVSAVTDEDWDKIIPVNNGLIFEI